MKNILVLILVLFGSVNLLADSPVTATLDGYVGEDKFCYYDKAKAKHILEAMCMQYTKEGMDSNIGVKIELDGEVCEVTVRSYCNT